MSVAKGLIITWVVYMSFVLGFGYAKLVVNGTVEVIDVTTTPYSTFLEGFESGGLECIDNCPKPAVEPLNGSELNYPLCVSLRVCESKLDVTL